jgi:hypothetical protein
MDIAHWCLTCVENICVNTVNYKHWEETKRSLMYRFVAFFQVNSIVDWRKFYFERYT